MKGNKLYNTTLNPFDFISKEDKNASLKYSLQSINEIIEVYQGKKLMDCEKEELEKVFIKIINAKGNVKLEKTYKELLLQYIKGGISLSKLISGFN